MEQQCFSEPTISGE